MFLGLPARDAETIAKARVELLAAERLKELCKQLGLAIPAQLQTYEATPGGTRVPTTPSASKISIEVGKSETSGSVTANRRGKWYTF